MSRMPVVRILPRLRLTPMPHVMVLMPRGLLQVGHFALVLRVVSYGVDDAEEGGEEAEDDDDDDDEGGEHCCAGCLYDRIRLGCVRLERWRRWLLC